jgi:hypothetical protein
MQRKKLFSLWLFLLVWLGSALAPGSAALRLYQTEPLELAPAPASPASLATLGWLAGSWEYRQSNQLREMHWTKPAGGTLLGLSRRIVNGQTIEHQFIQLRESGGTLECTIQSAGPVDGQPEIPFTLVAHNETTVIFENPQHEFPQRIVYQQQPDGSLLACFKGISNGKNRHLDWPFQRVQND